MAEKHLIVVGGGLAGLMSTIKAAEKGAHVDLFSVVPVKRSHSFVPKVALMVRSILKGKAILLGFTLMIQCMVATSLQTNHLLKR